MFRSKLRVLIDRDCDASISDIVGIIGFKYELSYCGKHQLETRCYLYIQHRTKMSPNILHKLLSPLLTVHEVGPFEVLEGNVLDSKGTFRKPRQKIPKEKKRSGTGISESNTSLVTNINNGTINNNNNTNNHITNNNTIQYINVNINPVGQETLEHITPEFIQTLLAECHGVNVIFKFGEEMYSIKENINFRSGSRDGNINMISRHPDGSVSNNFMKNAEAHNVLFCNLMNKNEEAVEKCKERIEIPVKDLDMFAENMSCIRNVKESDVEAEEKAFRKFRGQGMRCIIKNSMNGLKDYEFRKGKKIKLV